MHYFAEPEADRAQVAAAHRPREADAGDVPRREVRAHRPRRPRLAHVPRPRLDQCPTRQDRKSTRLNSSH